MGITNLFKMLQVIAPGAFTTVSRHGQRAPTAYDHVYFDVNNSIHRLAMRSKNEEEFYLRLFAEIDGAVGYAQPKHTVFIAVDGPGPRAKVVTQLGRRRRLNPKASRDLKRLGFTPGTGVLQRLQEALYVYAGQRIAQASNQYRAYWVSGADCPGEGELKAFDHMRSLGPRDRCLVVGNDSDLIAFGLQAPCQVDVVRSMDKGQMAMVSIPKIKKALCKGLVKPQHMKTAEWEQRIADDFVFLCIMSGNDYVPKVGHFALHSFWTQYRLSKRGPSFTGEFLFDAKTLECDWKMFGLLSGITEGADAAPKKSAGAMAVPHPKTLLNQLMLVNGGNNAVYTATEDENMVYNCEVSLFRGALKFTASALGKQNSTIEAALKALAPGSEMWALMDATFTQQQLVECAKIVDTFNKLRDGQPISSIRPYELGNVTAPEVPVAETKSEGLEIQSHNAIEQSPKMLAQFYEAIIWSYQLYQGVCRDYGYLFPHGDIIINKMLLCEAAPTLGAQLGKESKNALSPVVLGMCLLPGDARKLLPEPFRSIDMSTTSIADLFVENNKELVTNVPRLAENLDRIEKWAGEINHEDLSSEAQHLMQLWNPLVFMRKDNYLFRKSGERSNPQFKELKFKPPVLPKLPNDADYKRLQDPSRHPAVVCMRADAAGKMTGNTPYMVRAMSTMARVGKKLLRR